MEPREPSAMEQWAQSAREVYAVAQTLAGTEFVPVAMRNKPESVMSAILAGGELGLSPMTALGSLDIVEGRPALRAITLRALAQSHGVEIWTEESTDTRAVVCARRAGSEHIERSEWTIERARRFVVKRDGTTLADKANWKNQPRAMLVARATSEVVRLAAADLILGIPYSVEELSDGTETPTTTRRIHRKKAPAPAPDPKPRVIQPNGGSPAPEPAPALEPAPDPAPRARRKSKTAQDSEIPEPQF